MRLSDCILCVLIYCNLPGLLPQIRDFFIQKVHDGFRNVIEKEEQKEQFQAIFAKSNRERLIKLNFFEKGSEILKNVFIEVVLNSGTSFVEEMLDDRMCLFQEIYADCGMCYAIGFDPFGYSVFALFIYDITNDPRELKNDRSFLADRLGSVVRTFFKKEERDEWGEKYSSFLKKIFDLDMVSSICEMLSEYETNDLVENALKIIEDLSHEFACKECDEEAARGGEASILDEQLKKILKRLTPEKPVFTIWRDEVLGKLICAIKEYYKKDTFDERAEDQIFVAKEYLCRLYSITDLMLEENILLNFSEDVYDGFFQKVINCMKDDSGLKAVKNDPCVINICQLYNMDFPESENNKFEQYYELYASRFFSESKFVFDYYCKFKNAYGHLAEHVKRNWSEENQIPVEDWYAIIDNYYLKGAEEG